MFNTYFFIICIKHAQSENRTPVPTLEGLDDNHYTNCAIINV